MYKIGEIAKLMGISTEALRYYERKGMITPQKEESSNYRYYNAVQINHLLNIQKYLRYGFGLDDIKNRIHSGELPDTKQALLDKQKDLHRQQRQLALRQKSLQANLDCITMTESTLETCMLGFRPAMYFLPYMKNKELNQDDHLHVQLAQWLAYADLEFMSGRLDIYRLHDEEFEFEMGLGMMEEVAEFLDVHENSLIQYYEACPAIIFSYEATPQHTLQDIIHRVQDFAKEKKLTICGISLTRVLYSQWRDVDDYVVRHLVWIPYHL